MDENFPALRVIRDSFICERKIMHFALCKLSILINLSYWFKIFICHERFCYYRVHYFWTMFSFNAKHFHIRKNKSQW